MPSLRQFPVEHVQQSTAAFLSVTLAIFLCCNCSKATRPRQAHQLRYFNHPDGHLLPIGPVSVFYSGKPQWQPPGKARGFRYMSRSKRLNGVANAAPRFGAAYWQPVISARLLGLIK